MPSLVTHYHFAAMVRQAAEGSLAHAANICPSAYLWGAQGPDILYYHNAPLGSRTALLGQKMHAERVAAAFSALVRSGVRQNSFAALSYLLGFCTHYILDRRTHPYIQDTIRTRLKPRYAYDDDACHRLCEADLDAAVITVYLHKDQERFEAFRLLDAPPSDISRMIGRMLSDVGDPVYRTETAPGKVEAAMRTMRLVYSILHSGGNEGARMQVESLERMLGKPGLLSTMLRPPVPLPDDCANLSRRVWHKPHVPDVDRTETFFELMENSVPAALALQRAVCASYRQDTPINPLFFPANYNGAPLTNDTL